MTWNIGVVSDVICPWCFVGKRRLEKALRLLGDSPDLHVTWLPFQLNPGMPQEGMDRRHYRIAKFGSWERSQALDQQLAAAGAGDGIHFAFDRMARTPNTLDAHRLIWLAQREGVQEAVVEALFRGYFTEGLDVGSKDVLIRVAVNAGLPPATLTQFLGSNEGADEVLAEEAKARQLGITGVPCFLFNAEPVAIGAHEPEHLASVFRQAMAVASS